MGLNLFQVLKDIVDRPGVTGFEAQRQTCLVEYLSRFCDSVSIDVIGNVIGETGSGKRPVMLAGHYDQIGLMLNLVDEKGYGHFTTVGGIDHRVLYWARVRIWTGDEPAAYVTGTIGAKPSHLVERDARTKAVKTEDLHIDFGARDAEQADSWGVKPGCVATLHSPVERLGPSKTDVDLVVGAGFDDACSIPAFLRALELLEKTPLEGVKLYIVATVQEEIGLRGATVSGFNIAPWCALAVDVTHAQAPGVSASKVGDINIGKGPAIGVGANFTRELWLMMQQTAQQEKIPYQVEPIPAASGTDAWSLQVVKGGTITGLLSIPNRYMHSPNEVISIDDLENIGRLVASTIRELDRHDIPHTREVFRRTRHQPS